MSVKDTSHPWLLTAALLALAGYVDARGFLRLGGFFVSYMSGDATQVGIHLVTGNRVGVAAALIGSFIGGVTLGTLFGKLGSRWRGPSVLALVTALLVSAALVTQHGHRAAATLLMAGAMGAANTVLHQERGLGVTYVTGTMVRIGRELAGLVCGEPRWSLAAQVLFLLVLVSGAALGAVAQSWSGDGALWIAASAAGILSLAAWAWSRRHPEKGQ